MLHREISRSRSNTPVPKEKKVSYALETEIIEAPFSPLSQDKPEKHRKSRNKSGSVIVQTQEDAKTQPLNASHKKEVSD